MGSASDDIVRYLTEKGVEHRVMTHPPAASADEYHEVLGTRYEQQAKSIFLRVRGPAGKGFAVLAIQAQKRADLTHAATLLGAREVKLGTKEQLLQATGCGFGELPPLGGLYGIPLLFDADLLAPDEIYFNAGDLSISISLAPKALHDAERPLVY